MFVPDRLRSIVAAPFRAASLLLMLMIGQFARFVVEFLPWARVKLRRGTSRKSV